MNSLAKKVLLIGWDAADWKFLSPMMDEGLMPNLSKLVREGVSGKLATLDPPLSPTLWTSIATGKRPFKHGIHGFTEPDPTGKFLRPIFNTNRKVKAFWNILTQHGLKTHVVGWWPSHPAEPINGIMVSNLYQRASGRLFQPWPIMKGTVHPEELSETFAALRVHPEELTQQHIVPFVPNAAKIDQSTDQSLVNIAKVTADCSSIQSATTYIMDHYEWDCMAVYFDAIDHFCHGFMRYHPPRQEHIRMKDYVMYKEVVRAGCRYHDMMLGSLLQMADEDTTVILVSDHGFHPDHNRPKYIPKEPTGPAIEHSPYGIVAMKGPGIKKDELIFGSSLLDVTPTLLTLFGLSVGEDMDGKVLVQAFEKKPEIQTVRSWENINGEDGSHPQNLEIPKADMQAELQQLIELGYIQDPGDNIEKAIKQTQDENNYNLARAYIDGGKWKEGIEILEELHDDNPKILRYAGRLTHAYQAVGKYKDARRMVNKIREIYDREGPDLDLLEGTLLVAENRGKKALALFKKVESEAADIPHIHLRIGNAFMTLNKLEDAERAFLKELNSDSESFHAYNGLGLCYLRMLRYEEAAEKLLEAIGLLYYSPLSHYYLGEALIGLEKYEEATKAFENCLKMTPGMNQARLKLISIYEQFLNRPGKALKYKKDFETKIRGEITVVSGLPRSGTSMMMQMLEAGGLEIFTDKERTADDNNPKGYYEHEAVKSLAKNRSWIPEAEGKAVKIIAQLLKYLPMNFRYKIIFMERDIYEVIQSQQKMLSRNGKKIKTNTLPLDLIHSYEKTLKGVKAWAEKQPNVEIRYVQYSGIIENSFTEAMKIYDFLGGDLRPENMVSVVDEKLYRERIVKV